MMAPLRAHVKRLCPLALMLIVCATLSLSLFSMVAEGRLIRATDLFMRAYHMRLDAEPTRQHQIDGYFHGSGFPKAGRSLQQKIHDAEQFLAEQIPKSGIVGTGVAVVYEDQVVLAKGYGLRTSTNPDSKVSADAIFQIGSVTKTMIAIAIGILVEQKKLQWRDTVKMHLPWLELFDKYAEKHLTIGDLLSMNSGFGALPDISEMVGRFRTERDYVEALKHCEPQYSLRETPEYANVNFVILGQLIESVSELPWYTFLQQRVWEPLGMHHTYAAPHQVPVALRQQELNDGHFACEGDLIGPYDLVSASEMQLTPGREGGYDAAGSVVSSAADMAIFLRLLLNKGKVGNVTLLQSPSTIAEMITGKVVASAEISMVFTKMGLHSDPDGGTIAAGYGIDIIGQAIWGHAYYDKSGDVAAHQTRTGFAPSQKLGVILMGNTQVPEPHASFYLDHFRSYVLGIFLDVPKPVLDFEFAKWRLADQLEPPVPGAPRCGFRFWKDPPAQPLTKAESDALVGTYVATVSDKFFPEITIARSDQDHQSFTVEIEQIRGTVISIGLLSGAGSPMVLLAQTSSRALPLLATRNTENGQFTINFGVDFRKQQPSVSQ